MKGVSNIELTNVQTSTFIWTMYYIYSYILYYLWPHAPSSSNHF